MNNVQGNPKLAKSVIFRTGLDPNLSEYFKLPSLNEYRLSAFHLLKYCSHAEYFNGGQPIQ